MSTPTPAEKIQVASISDRGLSGKRPMNEDSFLADAARGIFVVADGVGGADAGEVASQKAVDVLNEAFAAKVADGEDVEDLMELAIQRANSAIHQMTAEHPRFSMMATTVVALHLDSNRATIGHVGDSRLYRLDPNGKLLRETDDHSIVEEEVRAGRMTPEQAANHPSKNVISRALGAEASVEADMKTIEVGPGNTFLLCTDGITRHLPDHELRQLLLSGQSVEAICTEMKERCYQRGAEDNLTAVIVQIGPPPEIEEATFDGGRTVANDRYERALSSAPATVETHLTPASRIAFPGPAASVQSDPQLAVQRKSGGGRSVLRFFVFLLFLGVAAGAFYAGMRYQQGRLFPAQFVPPQVTPTPQPADSSTAFEQKRSTVDANPKKWLKESVAAQMEKEGVGEAAKSKDSEFLYLYGRALMLTGSQPEAMQAFELALSNLRMEQKGNMPLGAEVKLAEASAALKVTNQAAAGNSQAGLMAEQKAARILDELLNVKSAATTP
jgi:protein phosphatase